MGTRNNLELKCFLQLFYQEAENINYYIPCQHVCAYLMWSISEEGGYQMTGLWFISRGCSPDDVDTNQQGSNKCKTSTFRISNNMIRHLHWYNVKVLIELTWFQFKRLNKFFILNCFFFTLTIINLICKVLHC